MSSLFKIITQKKHTDGRGVLVSLESELSVPFEIKRVYYLTELTVHPRGFHAHKNLTQILLCIKGSFLLTLDDGEKRESRLLNDPGVGVHISNNIWREMSEFSSDCVILVLADSHYDENDYIRDYEDFKKALKNDSSSK